MEGSKLLTMIVTVTVGIIFVGALLGPVIDDVSATEKTFTNDGYYYMQKITADDPDEIVFTYEYIGPTSADVVFTYNGETMDITGFPSQFTIATDLESFTVRMGANEYIGLQSAGQDFAMGGHNTANSTLTISQGTVTFVTVSSSDVTTTKTVTYTELWVYTDTPTDYVMKKMDKAAYITNESEYFGAGITAMTTWNTAISIDGDYEDFDATIIFPPNLTTTVTNKAIVETEVSGYEDLYSLDKLTFTINDGTTTVDATYSYFIVPAKVTAELSQHLDSGEIALLAVLPLLAITTLLLLAVRFFVRRD